VTVGRTDFDARTLLENYAALVDELIRAKPASAKGRYLRTITLATTMGPGIRVDPLRTRDIIEEIKEEGESTVAEAVAVT
jgi:large subunit ribosomal protein L1